MKKVLLTLSLCSFISISYASGDFEGTYHCKGWDPYLDKFYGGIVTVKQQGAVYSLEMDYDSGEAAIGTGGQYDPTLMSVVFQNKKNLKNIGLEQYHFTDEKKQVMQGYWVYLSKDKLGKEVCHREGGKEKTS